jgi:hypothetical protein
MTWSWSAGFLRAPITVWHGRLLLLLLLWVLLLLVLPCRQLLVPSLLLHCLRLQPLLPPSQATRRGAEISFERNSCTIEAGNLLLEADGDANCLA